MYHKAEQAATTSFSTHFVSTAPILVSFLACGKLTSILFFFIMLLLMVGITRRKVGNNRHFSLFFCLAEICLECYSSCFMFGSTCENEPECTSMQKGCPVF